MHPDGLMPVQGTGLSSNAPRRLLALAVGVIAGFLLVSTRHPNVQAPVAISGSPCTCYEAAAGNDIVALCRAGRADEALLVANAELGRVSQDSVLAGELHFLRGGTLRLLGREQDARADYSIAARLGTSSRQDKLDLMAQAGDPAAVKQLASQKLEADSNPYVVNNTCWDLAMCPGGNAVLAAQKMASIASSSTDASWIDTYAWSLYLSGHRQEAVQQEQRAIQFAGQEGDEHAACYQACLEGMLGQTEQAHRDLVRLFQNDITNTDRWMAAQRFPSE